MSSIKQALMIAGREYWDEFTKVTVPSMRCQEGGAARRNAFLCGRSKG